VLWEFDTGRAFPAVNGGEARGGAIDHGSQVIAHGMLYALGFDAAGATRRSRSASMASE
jgi:hypothetical protein